MYNSLDLTFSHVGGIAPHTALPTPSEGVYVPGKPARTDRRLF